MERPGFTCFTRNAVGASIFNVMEQAGEPLPSEMRWLLVLAVSITLVSLAVLTRTVQLNQIQQSTHQVGRRVMLVSALLILLLGFTGLETFPLLIMVILLLLAPIFFAFRVWVELLDQAD